MAARGQNTIQAGLEITAAVKGTEALADLAGEIEAAGGDASALRDEATRLGTSLQTLGKQQELISRFRELKTAARDNAAELQTTQTRVRELAQAMQANLTAALQTEFNAAKQQAAALSREQDNLNRRLQETRTAMNDTGISTRNLAREQTTLRTQVRQTQTELTELTNEAKKLRTAAAARVKLGLDVDGKGKAEIKALQDAFSALKQSGTATAAEIKRAEKNMTQSIANIKKSAQSAGGGMTPIASGIAKIGKSALALGGVTVSLAAIKEGLQAVLSKTMEFQQVRQRLDYAFGGMEQGAAEMDYVRGLSQKLGLELVTTANGYAQLASATKELNLSQADTQQIFSGVAHAAAAMHLSADDANGVFLALSQIAGKGKVSMEELRQQLGERLTPAMGIAAKSMGVTVGELEKMVEAGISAEEFLPKFGAALQETFAGEAAANAQTLSGQLNILKNDFAELLNGFGEGGIADAAIKVMQDIGEGIRWIEDQIDSLDGALTGNLQDAFIGVYDGIKEGVQTVAHIIGTVIERTRDLSNAFATMSGMEQTESSINVVSAALGGINALIGAVRDGFSAIDIAVDALAGTSMKAFSLIAKGLSMVSTGDFAKNMAATAEELDKAASAYFEKAQDKAMNFESQTIKGINSIIESEQERFAQLEQESRQAYQTATDAAIKAADDAKSARQQADAAIGTSAEAATKKQAEEAEKAAEAAKTAAQKAEQKWTESFANIGGSADKIQTITAPLREAGLAIKSTVYEAEKLSPALGNAKAAAVGLGLDVSAAMNTTTPALASVQDKVVAMMVNFNEMKEAGINAGNLVAQAMGNMLATAANASDINAVKATWMALGESGQASMRDVEQGILDANLRLQELNNALDPVAKSFEKLGIKTKQALGLAAQDMKAAFERARDSGQATTDDLQDAFKRTADAMLKSGDASAEAWVKSQAATYDYVVEIDNAGKASLKTAEEVEKSHAKQQAAIEKTAAKQRAAAEKSAETAQKAEQKTAEKSAEAAKQVSGSWSDVFNSVWRTANIQKNAALEQEYKNFKKGLMKSIATTDVGSYITQWSKGIKSYIDQVKSAQDATARLSEKIAQGTVNMTDIAAAAQTAGYRVGKIDEVTLKNLNAALDAARQKVQALRDEAAQTRASLDAELAGLRGDESKREQLEQESKLRELNLKLAEAQKAGDGQSIVDYQKAIKLQKDIYAEKQKQAALDKQRQQQEAEAAAQAKIEQERTASETAPQTAASTTTPIVLGDAELPIAATGDAAKLLASELSTVLGTRDQALIDKVVAQIIAQLRSEFKRMA